MLAGSYALLPLGMKVARQIYQIHTKYRDEIRAKPVRELTMLDAYSLDADDEGLDQADELVGKAN